MRLLSSDSVNKYGAGSKAPNDVSTILKKEYGFKEKKIKMQLTKYRYINKIKTRIFSIRRLVALCFTSNKEYYIMQTNYFHYPFFHPELIEKILSNKKIIILIHDIDGLRFSDSAFLERELRILNCAEYIIAHNGLMKEYLVKNGIPENKIYILECFDYLCNDLKNSQNSSNSNFEICYAGNLSKSKSAFLYEIDYEKIKYKINVYGTGLEEQISQLINYKGKYNAEDVRNVLKEKLGLVWDGRFDESDENNDLKNYTKYNNPHKLSCYLSADIPVIVWSKSAVADFVKSNNIGYTISNIYDINNLDLSDYEEKKKNVKLIGEKIRSGYYTTNTFKKIIEAIESSGKGLDGKD